MKRFLAFTGVLVFSAAVAISAKKPKKMEPEPKPVGDKPSITRVEPRGLQRGVETKIHLFGTNLVGITDVKLSNKSVTGKLDDSADDTVTEAWVKVTASAETPRGGYDLSVVNEKGESAKIKIYVDDLPQAYEIAMTNSSTSKILKTPVSYWGTFERAGDSDEVEVDIKSGQNLVFDLAAKSIGSKANVMMTLLDSKGNAIASNNTFDGGDPLLTYNVATSGRYKVRFSEENMGGSAEHFYRLSIGELPVVIGGFPLSVSTNANATVQMTGFNLPADTTVKFKAEKLGDMDVPVDGDKFRLRKPVKVLVSDQNEIVESEPNDVPAQAISISIPSIASGRIWNEPMGDRKKRGAETSTTDIDLYRFTAKAGQVLMFETDAARRGSPIDTKIEILHANGKPVERVLLQAVRDSHINFRSVDSMTGDIRVENWQEMELNEFMYMAGEVCRIFRMPEGPDSGFQFYRNNGKRITYFDTSARAHALDDPTYIVEPHPPGTKLVPNGLPVYTLYYSNDDDGEREIGSDSRLQFTAPADSEYLVRVTDTRGYSGPQLAYRLIAREAKHDFTVRLNNPTLTISPGSAQEFSYTVDRVDGFDDDITVEISGMPEGFYASTPVVIQAGQLAANGTFCAAADAKAPTPEAMAKVKITATAMINGNKVVKEVNRFDKINVGEKPKLIVAIEPYNESDTNFNVRAITDKPMEITVIPGEVVPVWLKIKREGHDDLVTFTVENLPHGVIVDNIGLNGVLIPKGEMERQVFLKCAKWVPETDRIAYCQAKQAGNPTSYPVLIHVRRAAKQTASVGK